MERQFLTVEDTAVFLGMSESWLRDQIIKRTIKFYKIGGRTMFRISDLEVWLEERAVPAGSKRKAAS